MCLVATTGSEARAWVPSRRELCWMSRPRERQGHAALHSVELSRGCQAAYRTRWRSAPLGARGRVAILAAVVPELPT
jgi:hypothetical protein